MSSYPGGSIGAMFPEAAAMVERLLAERNTLELKLAAVEKVLDFAAADIPPTVRARLALAIRTGLAP